MTTTTSLGPSSEARVWNFFCLSPGLPQMRPFEFQVAPWIDPFQGFVVEWLMLLLLFPSAELVLELLVTDEEPELPERERVGGELAELEDISLLFPVASVSIVLFLRFLSRRSELGGALALLALELRCNLRLSKVWRTVLGDVAEDAQPSPLAS